jgi:site-specific recombinase XerD
MKKPNKEAVEVAKHIYVFLNEYAPTHLTGSLHTLKAYRIALILYMTFLETVMGVGSESLKFDCFFRKNIEKWIEWLLGERNCSNATANIRLASLRTFLKYLGSRDSSFLYLYQEASLIPRKKTLRKKVDGLTKDAVKILLEAPDASDRIGKRDLTFMVFLYSTAARMDELLDMRVKQLHLGSRKPYANIIGKGNKIRTLYLLPKTVVHIERYLDEFHGERPDPDAYLFYSRNVGKHGKMSQTAVDKFLKKYATRCHTMCSDVPLNLHAHQFRHAKASHWLEDGINIVQISFLLGHENIQTTMIYMDITTEQVAEALATLEDEKDQTLSPKCKKADGSLVDFCGLKV